MFRVGPWRKNKKSPKMPPQLEASGFQHACAHLCRLHGFSRVFQVPTSDISSLKTNSKETPLKIGLLPQKGNQLVFQASIFRCYALLLVSGREKKCPPHSPYESSKSQALPYFGEGKTHGVRIPVVHESPKKKRSPRHRLEAKKNDPGQRNIPMFFLNTNHP